MVRADALQITSEFLTLIAAVDEFKGAWRALGTLAPDRLSALRRVASIESIGSSTRLGGSQLTDREVERLLSSLKLKGPATRDEQEAAGYADLMGRIAGAWQDLPLTEKNIKQWHRDLLSHSGIDAWHRGEYKTSGSSVETLDPGGVQLEATPRDTPRLMAGLVAWVQAELAAGELHPLLVIGIWAVRFLWIRPFQDGNGRLSRALTTLLLLRSGYAYVPFSSLESVIERNQEACAFALRGTQSTLSGGSPDWQPWLSFFLRALHEQMRILARKLEREKTMLAGLPPHSVKMVEFVREHGRMTMREAVQLTGASRNTLKGQLRILVEKGRLTLRGGGRGACYELP